jgi:hypothetical protein
MTRLTYAFVFLALLFSAEIAFAQDLANQIVGVWQFGPSTRKYDGGDTTNRQISGTVIFTKGGHFAVMQHPAEPKTPANDAELAALARTSFFGSGTYKVEGDKVVLKYEVCGNPTWIGQERRPNMKVDGKTMTWLTPPIKDADGKSYVDTYTNTRVE